MSFEVAGEAYARFMGVYADPLAPRFADFADVESGRDVVDVGCGPGALTAELVRRCGAESVRAIDPSPPFVEACRSRLPDVEVSLGGAEELPYDDDTCDVAVAQLVVPFMRDPFAGLREMARVTRPGGVVAVCAWDHVGGTGPLSPFWSAVRETEPGRGAGESPALTDREQHLADYVSGAGLVEISTARLTVDVSYQTIDQWWEPFTLGVGPAGDWVARLDDADRARVREIAAKRLGNGPFTISATANAVRGQVSRRTQL